MESLSRAFVSYFLSGLGALRCNRERPVDRAAIVGCRAANPQIANDLRDGPITQTWDPEKSRYPHAIPQLYRDGHNYRISDCGDIDLCASMFPPKAIGHNCFPLNPIWLPSRRPLPRKGGERAARDTGSPVGARATVSPWEIAAALSKWLGLQLGDVGRRWRQSNETLPAQLAKAFVATEQHPSQYLPQLSPCALTTSPDFRSNECQEKLRPV
jgi:hypothetical protein